MSFPCPDIRSEMGSAVLCFKVPAQGCVEHEISDAWTSFTCYA